jgi:transposase-like protein
VGGISLEKAIRDNVEVGSTIHTDEFQGYKRIGKSYRHEKINHSKDEYSRNGVTTNGIESVFAVLKRGLHGVYHHASKKHMGRYVDEFTFRLNDGNVKRHTWDRLDSFVDAVAGKRLTYERLTK